LLEVGKKWAAQKCQHWSREAIEEKTGLLEESRQIVKESFMHKTLILTIITLLSTHATCRAITIDYVVTDGTSYATIGFSHANIRGEQYGADISINGRLFKPSVGWWNETPPGPSAGFYDMAGVGHFWSVKFALDGTIIYEKPDPNLGGAVTLNYDAATFSGSVTLGNAPVPETGNTGLLVAFTLLPCAVLRRSIRCQAHSQSGIKRLVL
jgi:hypothetical protein